MDTDSFLVDIKADNIYKDIAGNVETRFDNSNFELNRPFSKDELDIKTMTKFVGLGVKTYSYLIDDGSEYKKAKGTKKCVLKKT